MSILDSYTTTDFTKWIEMGMHSGIYPLSQALGIVYLKLTKDPLEGISKLDCLQLVSIY